MTPGNDVSRSTRFQPAEEARDAFAQGSESVAAFLHHHNGYVELPNHRSHPDEEVGWQFEAADRIGGTASRSVRATLGGTVAGMRALIKPNGAAGRRPLARAGRPRQPAARRRSA